jgi:hypothetical protein
MTSALFWDIRQCRVVVLYRRFGTIYQSHLQASRSSRRKLYLDLFTLEDEADRLSRNVGTELPLYAVLYPRKCLLLGLLDP